MAMWALNFSCLLGVSFHVTQMTKWILNRFSPWAEESLRLVLLVSCMLSLMQFW